MSLAEFFKHDFNEGDFELYNKKGELVFWEDSDEHWLRYEHDENRNLIFFENSKEFWVRYERDENGKITFWEDSKGRTSGTNVKLKTIDKY